MPRGKKCQHHWDIDVAAGPTSIGTCRRCKKRKKFNNTIEQVGIPWGGDKAWFKRPSIYGMPDDVTYYTN